MEHGNQGEVRVCEWGGGLIRVGDEPLLGFIDNLHTVDTPHAKKKGSYGELSKGNRCSQCACLMGLVCHTREGGLSGTVGRLVSLPPVAHLDLDLACESAVIPLAGFVIARHSCAKAGKGNRAAQSG